ncbi:MAG: glycoside hydrolase family 3 C-terminal domain-containing protein, partial [Cellulosilyticaceae bacterium]
IDETIIHGYTRDGKEAAKACVEAGIDIEMMSSHYINYGKELVEEGKLSVDLIDEAVRRILTLKEELGLFENPYKDASEEMEEKIHLCPEHIAKAKEVARDCAVLLKNEGALPIQKGIKVGIAGPFAEFADTMGGWCLTNKQNNATLATELEDRGIQVVTAMTKELGAMQDGIFDVEDEVAQAVEAFADCDVIIAAVGEHPWDSGESASRTNLRLSPNQEKLIQQLHTLGKPVVALLFGGRPLEIAPVLPYCDAVLEGWFLGTESSSAIVDILLGEHNPCGRLSMSFPQTVGQIPVHYNCYNTGRPNHGKRHRYVSCYLDCDNEPLYPFGYGLSYGQVDYTNFDVEVQGEKVVARITLENTSEYIIKETVQLYIRDLYASIVRPVKEMKDFTQVVLAPGEKQEVTFEVTKEMLMFYNNKLEYVFEAGEFDIMIGRNAADVQSKTICLE